MSKQIIGLNDDPLSIQLVDRACSLFINPESGLIYLDEGIGDDRMNGAVCDPARGPRFSLEAMSDQGELLLTYGTMRWTVGQSERVDELHAWADKANAFLALKMPGDFLTEHSRETTRDAEPELRQATG